ncbi:MAG: hypothetical protein AUH41_10915 [Gemmatimonadetes bacterium 13_1_40CM_66_11]|nr:MAG: hypothetical protein AUH41_10915 [Gemmatimonadetes bacterium 13_1_40CM_66_11]
MVALILIAACSDRTVTPPAETPIAASAVNAKRPEALAKMFAKGLKNAAFRAYLKAQLNVSPYREHKLQFETFLADHESRALREIAAENATTKDAVESQVQAAIALEVYFPVPAHRGRRSADRVRSRRPAPGARSESPARHARPGDRPGRNRLLGSAGARHGMHHRLRRKRGRADRRRRAPPTAGPGLVHDQKPFRARL